MLSRLMALVRRQAEAPDAPLPPADAIAPLVDIVAFAADCAVAARVRVDTDRLSDLLNGRDAYRISGALVQSLDDGRMVELGELELYRDELLVVQVAGPRGHRERRLRTVAYPVEMQVGPYRVHGYLHVRPGTNAMRVFPRREEMVPLTDAWVSYEAAGVPQRQPFGAVAVNRLWVDWIAESTDDQVQLPGPVMPYPTGPLLKDFTGHVLGYER